MDETPMGRAEHSDDDLFESSIDGAPVGVRILQAAVIGVVAGLALNAIVSMVALHGESLTPKHASPKQCKKQAPANDAASPKVNAPTISGVRWKVDGVQASFELPPDVLLTP
jgi:hypothetical protein